MAWLSSGCSVFYPKPALAADNLKNAMLFTRLHLRTTPQTTQAVLDSAPQLRNTFLLGHLNNVLIFDTDHEQHVAHVNAVLDMLRGKDIKADIELCAFHKPSWTEAGFYIDPIGKDGQQAFLVTLREHLAPDALAAIDREL